MQKAFLECLLCVRSQGPMQGTRTVGHACNLVPQFQEIAITVGRLVTSSFMEVKQNDQTRARLFLHTLAIGRAPDLRLFLHVNGDRNLLFSSNFSNRTSQRNLGKAMFSFTAGHKSGANCSISHPLPWVAQPFFLPFYWLMYKGASLWPQSSL